MPADVGTGGTLAAMETERVLSFLGQPSDDSRVVRMLQSFGLDKYRPALDPDDPEALTDWFPVKEQGIEFGFKDEAYLLALDPALRRKGRLVFYEVILYGEHPLMARFAGPLPFGLSFDDSRSVVRTKLGRMQWPSRSHIRDVWETPSYRLVVSYAPDESRVTDVIAYLPDSPWPTTGDEGQPMPSMADVIGLLGVSPRDPFFVETFTPVGVMYQIDVAEVTGAVNMREEFGFELNFELVSSGPHRARPRTSILKGITLYRERDLESRGWRGEMPFDIRMDDSPPQVLAKVGTPPVRQSDHRLTGSALWHFDTFSLHVMYSTLDNLVYRVTVSRPVVRH
jgi:hypothetical protein